LPGAIFGWMRPAAFVPVGDAAVPTARVAAASMLVPLHENASAAEAGMTADIAPITTDTTAVSASDACRQLFAWPSDWPRWPVPNIRYRCISPPEWRRYAFSAELRLTTVGVTEVASSQFPGRRHPETSPSDFTPWSDQSHPGVRLKVT
jgi:hypothetical protein